MRIDIPTVPQTNSGTPSIVTPAEEEGAAFPGEFLAQIRQCFPELEGSEGNQPSGETPAKQDDVPRPDNVLSLLLGAALIRTQQSAEPAQSLTCDLSGAQSPVPAETDAAVIIPRQTAVPQTAEVRQPIGVSEPVAPQQTIVVRQPVAAVPAPPERAEDIPSLDVKPQQKFAGPLHEETRPSVPPETAAEAFAIRPGKTQSAIDVEPTRKTAGPSWTAEDDSAPTVNQTEPEDPSTSKEPIAPQESIRRTGSPDRETVFMRTVFERPESADAPVGLSQVPRDDHTLNRTFSKSDFLPDGMVKAAPDSKAVAQVPAATPASSIQQQVVAGTPIPTDSESSPVSPISVAGKTPMPDRREPSERNEVNPAVNAVDPGDRKGTSFTIGNSQPAQMDVDPGRTLRQGFSDPRHEGNPQLMSGAVVAAEGRDAASRLPAQVPAADKSQFFDQLAEKFQILVRNGTGEIRIQLRPENLGKLEINAQTGLHGVIARIATESGSVKSYLESNLHLLHQSFQDQGLKVERIDVLLQGGVDARYAAAQQESHDHSGSAGSQGNPSPASTARTKNDPPTDEVAVDPATLMYLRPHSTFHTTA
jgi:hypothetical protein